MSFSYIKKYFGALLQTFSLFFCLCTFLSVCLFVWMPVFCFLICWLLRFFVQSVLVYWYILGAIIEVPIQFMWKQLNPRTTRVSYPPTVICPFLKNLQTTPVWKLLTLPNFLLQILLWKVFLRKFCFTLPRELLWTL